MMIREDENDDFLMFSQTTRYSSMTFPSKLFALLNHERYSKNSIRWGEDDKSFIITDKEEFCAILPKFFNRKFLALCLHPRTCL